MNTYGIIILAALLLEYGADLLAGLLTVRSLGIPLPDEMKGFLDEARYATSQRYTRTRTLFGLAVSTFNLALVLLFWFSGGFNFLDLVVRNWNLGPLWSGEVYVGILVALRAVLSLPFSMVSTFVIEERFGFNRTAPATFVADLLKGAALGILLGGPLLFGLLALFEYAGAGAWVLCWMGGTVIALVLHYVAPVWIMPLFNSFTPLPDGELREAIFSYASAVKFPLREVSVMDGSRRSGKSNAFFTGFGKNKRIALFDTLIAKHSVSELVAVLAHEIGHYKKKHVVQGLVISILHMGLMLYLLSQFVSRHELADAFFMSHGSVYAGLVFFGMLYIPVEFFLSLGLHALSRKNEYAADRFASETTGSSESMVRALKRLSADNLANLTPHPFQVVMSYSHPPVLDRIRALMKS